MPRWTRAVLTIVLLIIGLLIASIWVVPWQVEKQAQTWFDEQTERTLSISEVSFNPLTLTLDLRELKLSEPGGTSWFLRFDQLIASVSIRSLLDQALILDRLELYNPGVRLVYLGSGTFNFSDLTSTGDNTESAINETGASGEPLHYSLNNLIIRGGAIDFTDRSDNRDHQHRIRELSLDIPFIGNIPYLTYSHVQPRLSMLLNGSEVTAHGRTRPFHDSLETTFYLGIDSVALPFYADRTPVSLPVQIEQGELDVDLDIDYRVKADTTPQLIVSGQLLLSNLDLRQSKGEELFSLSSLYLELTRGDLLQQEFNLSSLELERPRLHIARDAEGHWNLQQLTPAGDAAAETSPVATSGETQSLPGIRIAHLKLIDGKVLFRDQAVPEIFTDELQAINLQLDNFSTHRREQTGFSLALNNSRSARLQSSGTLGLNPLAGELQLDLQGLSLKPWYPYLASRLARVPEGHLALNGKARYLEDGNLQLEQLEIDLEDLLLPFVDEDRLTLKQARIRGGQLDLQNRELALQRLAFSGGDLRAGRRTDGSLTPLSLLRADPSEDPSDDLKDSAPEPSIPPPPWQVRVGTLELTRFSLVLRDALQPRRPVISIPKLTLQADDLRYPDSAASPFELDARIGDQGRLKINGTLAHSPLLLAAETGIENLALTDFNGFIPERLKLRLRDGRLHSRLKLQLKQESSGLRGAFSGETHIDRFSLEDPLGQGEMLAWETLNLNGIEGALAPLRLHIEEVALSDYLANILVSEDGRINLTSTTPEDEASTDGEITPSLTENQASEPEPPAETETPPADIRIAALTLQGGTVSFVDRHLPSTFATTMYQLGGRVTGLASDPAMQADVDLRGELENHSPLTVSGRINPLSRELFADLTISFKEIDLTPLTPYSGTYLGYVIDKGKLYLDLDYHIEHQQIDADNRVLIDQFTFGDSVASEKATSLPVGLAVALLKDARGEIHLDIPVSGNLADPEFSVAGAIFTIIKNLLVKAATAPFSLLASMFGGEEDFSNVTFPPGTAQLDAAQREKLDKLAGMLLERPVLTLEISGFVDPDKDPEAYRRLRLEEHLQSARQALQAETQTQPPDAATKDAADREEESAANETQETETTAEEIPPELWQVYQQADFPRPTNPDGSLKILPAEELEKLLLANIRADAEVLQQLARDRAMTVRDALVSDQEEIKPRLFLTPADITREPENDTPASRVEFTISRK